MNCSLDILACIRATISKFAELDTFALLHYRHIEKVQITVIKYHYNDFDKKVDIPGKEKTEIQ